MSNARVYHDLCRYPKWQLDQIEATTNGLSVRGWALPFRDEPRDGTILLNGQRPSALEWAASPDIDAIYPYLPGAKGCRFSATYALPQPPEVATFSHAGVYSQEPYNPWSDLAFPLSLWARRAFVAPESEGMKRTQGSDSLFRYVAYGYSVATRLELALMTYFGKTFSDFATICDWGVGCGRVAQMTHHLAPGSDIVGLDIDAQNIAWCARALPFGRYHAVPLLPPTGLADGAVDLVYGVSVFTHLHFDAFRAWVGELARILRPGGVALVSMNMGAATASLIGQNEALVARIVKSGFDAATHDRSFNEIIGDADYYRLTFLTPRVARALFSQHFRIRDILPQANASTQDIVVCERV